MAATIVFYTGGIGSIVGMFALVSLLGACSPQGGAPEQGGRNMSCKLKDDKIVQGRSRQCLYLCDDSSIEGRTRGIEQSCPNYISSQKPRI
jgi:hypothetical protein